MEAILPLTWAGPLRAEYDGKDTWLDWSVTNQIGTDHFIVEHAQAGRAFFELGQLAAAGSEVSAINYRFRHALPQAGDHLYRIRQVDLDGRSTLSSLTSVEVGAKLSAFPNPTNGILTLTGLPEGTRSVELFDGAGRRLKVVNVAAGWRLDLSGLKGGHYWLRPLNQPEWISIQLK